MNTSTAMNTATPSAVEAPRKDLLRFLTCGSVDDGKSTLIGRLLHDSRMVYDDQIEALKRDSAKRSSAGGAIDFSLLVDGLQSEREQGITIDVAYRYFATERRKFIIADTPGHEQYTRNMATGASTANLAVILVDARLGILPQTKRHSFIASLLGIKHLVVAVNKMDLMGYSQEVFEKIRQEYTDFAARLEAVDIRFIPLSALNGDNVVTPSEHMPWYHGGPLLEYLETVHIASDRNLIDLRFPVQYVLRPDLNFRGFCGTIASGRLRKGDEVLALPSGRRTKVKSIVTFEGELNEAFAPQAVTVTLADEVDVGRGDMLVHARNVPHRGNSMEAMVVWMSADPMKNGRNYWIKHTSNMVTGIPSQTIYRMDVNTLHRHPPGESGGLELNEIGRVVFQLNRPIFFDAYTKNRATGSFIIIDRTTNVTVGAGMILDREPNELVATETKGAIKREGPLQAHPSSISPAERAKRLGQQGAVIWLTGLPRAGKSTLAFALEKKLFELGHVAAVLDGENMRLGLCRDLGFSADDRSENSRRSAEVARILADSGLLTLAAFTSPFSSDREAAKAAVGAARFIEVYLSAPVAECEKRDPTLYEKARSGEIRNFTGVSSPYEPPVAPDLLLATHELTPAVCVEQVLARLKARGILSA